MPAAGLGIPAASPFSPFPGSGAVALTGGVPLEEFKRDRPREYQQMVEAGELESNLMPAPQRLVVTFWRRFGFTALAMGLSLIALIVYAALFVYR